MLNVPTCLWHVSKGGCRQYLHPAEPGYCKSHIQASRDAINRVRETKCDFNFISAFIRNLK